jgi:uncharacterized lipoprotein NlpE involved in copper resistance
MKRVVIAALLVILLFLFAGCEHRQETQEQRITSAKVRYFDGSMDTLLLKSYTIGRTMVFLHTEDGRTVVIGPNNVIVIEETESQYECQEGGE